MTTLEFRQRLSLNRRTNHFNPFPIKLILNIEGGIYAKPNGLNIGLEDLVVTPKKPYKRNNFF